METKANYVLIGAFAIAGFLGMIGFLMWFSNLQLNRQFAYYDAYFPEVTGLTVSSQVLFAGLDRILGGHRHLDRLDHAGNRHRPVAA